MSIPFGMSLGVLTMSENHHANNSSTVARCASYDRGADDLCADYCKWCNAITDHLACWMEEPELGVCPLLSGEALNV